MSEPALVQLAQDLEWLGCEEEYFGHKHALEGYPESGPNWDAFCEKRRGVLATVDKLERELKNSVRFNPSRLVGIEYPIDENIDSVAELMAAVEDIRQSSMVAVQDMPSKVRAFSKMVEGYLKNGASLKG